MFQKWLDSGGSSYTQLYKALVKCRMMDIANLLEEKYPAFIKHDLKIDTFHVGWLL